MASRLKPEYEVLIYFWDERDGPELCGWWFGPKALGLTLLKLCTSGGWRPSLGLSPQLHCWNSTRLPAARLGCTSHVTGSRWNVPHDGPIDKALAWADSVRKKTPDLQHLGHPSSQAGLLSTLAQAVKMTGPSTFGAA